MTQDTSTINSIQKYLFLISDQQETIKDRLMTLVNDKLTPALKVIPVPGMHPQVEKEKDPSEYLESLKSIYLNNEDILVYIKQIEYHLVMP